MATTERPLGPCWIKIERGSRNKGVRGEGQIRPTRANIKADIGLQVREKDKASVYSKLYFSQYGTLTIVHLQNWPNKSCHCKLPMIYGSRRDARSR